MIHIRPATTNDINLLTELGRSTFTESFEHLNNPIPFQKYLDTQFQAQVIEQEYNTDRNHFFIAEADGKAAGFCKLVSDETEDHADLSDKKCLQLERIYVLKEFQGLNIGRMFLDKAFEFANEYHFALIWLGVWEKNDKAIKIYEKWGFEPFGSHEFNLGGDIQTDFLYKKLLS